MEAHYNDTYNMVIKTATVALRSGFTPEDSVRTLVKKTLHTCEPVG